MAASPEELLCRLAASPGYAYPREVVEELVSRLEEATPWMLEVLERLAEDPGSFDEDRDWKVLVFSAFLLAQARETRAFGPLVSLLSLSSEEVELLWGDLVADGMGRILASVYDGDEAALRGLIEDPAIDEFVRGASVVHCYEALVTAGRIERDAFESYVGELLESRLERSPSVVWDALASLCGTMRFERHLPLVERAFAEDLCDSLYSDLSSIVKEAKRPVDQPSEPGAPTYSLIADTIAETERWACFHPASNPRGGDGGDGDEEPSAGFSYHTAEELAGTASVPAASSRPMDPYVREAPKIGRNDPCPCGSGKKFKKCCG